MRTKHRLGLGLMGLAAYDSLLRPWMLDWGASDAERADCLPGDELAEDVMTHHTRAITIDAPPEAVWPWLVQIGDHRAGFYSYDWIENYLFPGTVHRVDGKRSAIKIHPELQDLKVGDRIDTGSIGNIHIGNPVTILRHGEALVIGSWAFVLRPLPGSRTRLLVRERDLGWLRLAAPRWSGLLRASGGFVDYVVGEPLHFVACEACLSSLVSPLCWGTFSRPFCLSQPGGRLKRYPVRTPDRWCFQTWTRFSPHRFRLSI